MRKKLIKFICFAAVLVLSSQFVFAQLGDVGAIDPVSPTSSSTNGRFLTDIDNFLNVNGWSGVTMDKWFSYLKAGNIAIDNVYGFNMDNWQAGMALKLSNVYLGLYYYGRYNQGSLSGGQITSNKTGITTTPTWDGAAIGGTGVDATGNQHQNYFGALIGIGNHGIKISVLDTLAESDFEVTSVANPGVLTFDDDDDIATPALDVPGGLNGYYRHRDGALTPRIQWGAAQPLQLGKFSAKPNAFFQLGIAYVNEQEWEFKQDTDTDNDGVTRYYQDGFAANNLVPRLGVDTGSITFFQGDWGSISAGISEEIAVKVIGDGYNHATEQLEPLAYENKLQPYAGFSYTAAEFFKVAARVDVPIWFGSNGNATTPSGFFGIGAKAAGATADPGATNQTLPYIRTGFQINGGVLGKLSDSLDVLKKLNVNFGIRVNLPGYLYKDSTVSYVENGDEYPHTTDVTYTRTPSHTWYNSVNNVLQSMALGFSFAITPKAMLDYNIVVNMGPELATHTILFSLKH